MKLTDVFGNEVELTSTFSDMASRGVKLKLGTMKLEGETIRGVNFPEMDVVCIKFEYPEANSEVHDVANDL